MAYRVRIERKARDIFLAADEAVREIVREEMVVLAESPGTEGRPACMPYVPIGWVYEFARTLDERRNFFTIFYVFDPEQEVLYITDFLQRH